jgi:ADP-ribose pyrophosphatase
MSFENLVTTKLTDERWLNLYKTTFKHRGKDGSWLFASRERGPKGEPLDKTNAVVVVPILVASEGERKLVLIKEYRIPIQTYEYHFPAGLLEKGESVEDCVRRELKEETGFDFLKINHVSKPLVSSSGMSDESVVMVFADCTYGNGKQQLEATEDIEVILVAHNEVREWVGNDVVFAAKTWPVLLMYQQIGSFEFDPLRA